VLLVDAGDFAGDPNVAGRLQTDALIEGMNALGYAVANASQRDLAHGLDAFLAWQGKARFELISANLVWQDTGEPAIAPTTVRTVALREGSKAREVRLGFIGLTRNNPAFQQAGPGGRRLVTIDPVQAALKHLPALRQKADVIVALVALPLDEARRLPRQAKEIDLVLGGHGGMQTRTDDFPEDTRIGRARLMYIGDQGKNVGEVRLDFDAQKAIASTQRSVIGLGREWPEDAALARLMETTKIAVNEHHKAQAAAASPFAAPETPGGALAAPGIPASASTAPVAAAGRPGYTGSERCAACHDSEYAVWSASAHAHAFDILVRSQQDFNPKCVGCHTVGFGQDQGFVNARATPGLIHVGCESCHGPSSRHPDEVQRGYGRTDVSQCLTCHTRNESPDYDPAEYIPKVRHWAGTQARR
jgi:hypothetical protein